MIVPKKLYKMLKALLERETGLPVLGYLPHFAAGSGRKPTPRPEDCR